MVEVAADVVVVVLDASAATMLVVVVLGSALVLERLDVVDEEVFTSVVTAVADVLEVPEAAAVSARPVVDVSGSIAAI